VSYADRLTVLHKKNIGSPVVAAIFVGVVIGGLGGIVFQSILAMILLGVVFYVWGTGSKGFHNVPWLVLPISLPVAAAFLTVVSGPLLNSWTRHELERYAYLRTIELTGTCVAAIVVGIIYKRHHTDHNTITTKVHNNKEGMANTDAIALCLLAISVSAALIFWYSNGIPVIATGLEQARVDAAAPGTGAFRVAMHFGIPACFLLFSSRNRWRWPSLLIASVLLASLGNRSVLVYLFAPLVLASVLEAGRIGDREQQLRLYVLLLVAPGIVVAGATYRVLATPEMASYDEYRSAVGERDLGTIARISTVHYAGVVANNLLITDSLYESELLERQYGLTLLDPLHTALPVERSTLDQRIREASGRRFLGGGIPPTLAGEGLVNFGLPGIAIWGFSSIAFPFYWFRKYMASQSLRRSLVAHAYCYSLTWTGLAQVAGFSGASTIPMLVFLLYIVSIRFANK
jgi:hypothetical protein